MAKMKHEVVKEIDDKPAEALELVVTSKSVGSLETNIRALELFVDKKLEDYKPENYLGDADLAKKDRAELNNAKKTLQQSRIALINELMKPYVDFEDRCKALEKKVDMASKALDEIVKAKESEEKERKKALIEQFWTAKKFDLFPLEKVFNPKWLNKTFKESDIIAEMDARIDKTYKDLKSLERYGAMYEMDAETIKAHYLMNLDVEETIQYADELQKQREVAAKEKAERAEREHEQKIAEQKREVFKAAVESARAEDVSSLADLAAGGDGKPERKEFVVSVKCYDEDLMRLKAAMNALGIEYSVEELEF